MIFLPNSSVTGERDRRRGQGTRAERETEWAEEEIQKKEKKGKRIPSCLACNNFFDDGIKWRNATSKRSIDFSEDDGKENESKVGPDLGRLSPTPHTTNRDGSETTNRRKTRGKGTWDTIRPDEKEEKKEKKRKLRLVGATKDLFSETCFTWTLLSFTPTERNQQREKENQQKKGHSPSWGREKESLVILKSRMLESP